MTALALMVGDTNKTLLKSLKCCDLSEQLSLQVASWRENNPTVRSTTKVIMEVSPRIRQKARSQSSSAYIYT